MQLDLDFSKDPNRAADAPKTHPKLYFREEMVIVGFEQMWKIPHIRYEGSDKVYRSTAIFNRYHYDELLDTVKAVEQGKVYRRRKVTWLDVARLLSKIVPVEIEDTQGVYERHMAALG